MIKTSNEASHPASAATKTLNLANRAHCFVELYTEKGKKYARSVASAVLKKERKGRKEFRGT